MFSSVVNSNLCSCSLVINQDSSIPDDNTKAVPAPFLKKGNKALKVNETRRKVTSKKILKQAKFTYRSKHLSAHTQAACLVSQLDNLSLENGISNRSRLSDSNAMPQPSTSKDNALPRTSNLVPSSSDCCGKFTSMNLNVIDDLPSFSSVKVDNTEKVWNKIPLKFLSLEDRKHLKRLQNRKSFIERRKERMRSQNLPVPDKIGPSSNTPTSIAAAFAPATTSCAQEAHLSEMNAAVCELSAYMENYFVLPKKMSSMAEMMYT